MEANERIYETLLEVRENLKSDELAKRVQDGMPAAELHAFYVGVGREENWIYDEMNKPLRETEPGVPHNFAKNVDSALDTVNFWIAQYEDSGKSLDLETEMTACVDYKNNVGNPFLEAAAESQHDQWRSFVVNFQPERIDPRSVKFREGNFKEFCTSYKNLDLTAKEKDGRNVSLISDVVLGLAGIGYERKIDTSRIFE